MADIWDAVIIGAGHNGLVCGFYLAAGGMKVKIVERRHVVGGAAVTEEFHPGFRNSVAAYTVSLLQPKIIADLELARHGLKIVERRALNFVPLPDGRHLMFGPGRTHSEIAKFSRADADAHARYSQEMERIADLVRSLLLEAPPNLQAGGLFSNLGALLNGARQAGRAARLTMEERRILLDLMTRSVGEYLDDRFETDVLKALIGFDGIVGTYASPYAAGTAYVQLHHLIGEVNGRKGVWGHAIGGMGAITQAMARAAEERGVSIETRAGVREVVIEGGRAAGVRLEDGRVIRARTIAANVGPKLLFERLIPDGVLSPEFRTRIARYKCGSGTFRMNVALSELPSFTALAGREIADHHTAGIVIAPSLGYMDRAYTDAREHGWSQEPIIEMLIPSTLDETLAPKGAHVASLFCQHVAPELPGGKAWDASRDEVADLMIATVDQYAPGFKRSVIARQALSPADLERVFGLVGGDIFHGRLSLDQLYAARPILGYADYRSPVPGLYLCGSGTHPGGGVSGAPGHNAARAILADMRRRVRWPARRKGTGSAAVSRH
jgi:phytoene dehydrogenase-like protein